MQKHPSLRIRRPRPNTEALSRDRRQPSNQQRRSAPSSLARTLQRRLNPKVLSAPISSNLRPAQPERCEQRRVQQTETAYELDSRGLSNRGIRTRRAQCYLCSQADPLLAFVLSKACPSRASTPCLHGISSHGLYHIPEHRSARECTGSPEFQRTARCAHLLRDAPTLMRFVPSPRSQPELRL